ncbi:MAG TPA: response regulator transcription factor [Mycobacteriales bacterium]|jgi:DNA-binding NarL/FixJ family response regulator|nr:response regulator transcription factor [Mycobacteriales bacterium]
MHGRHESGTVSCIGAVEAASEMATERTRVLIVEDHQLLAQSLALALRAEGFAVDVARLGCRADLLVDLADPKTALVLLDLDLGPQIGDGSAFVRLLAERGVAVIVVSGITDRIRLAPSVEAGAVGVVSKSQPMEDLVEAVKTAMSGQLLVSENDRQEMLADLRRDRHVKQERLSPFDHLTQREREVLVALGNGLTVRTIAQQSFVSEATVRSQVHAVLTKLGVNSQIAAIAKARQTGWLSIADDG